MGLESVEISIIIPVYNTNIDFFKKCIDSIHNQTFDNYEVIIVDDGSDSSIGLQLDIVCQSKSKISIIHTENKGVSMARNLGIQMSKGNFVMYVDADDYIAPWTLEDMWRIKVEYNADIVTSYIKPVEDEGYVFARNCCLPQLFSSHKEKEYLLQNILCGFNTKQSKYGYMSGGPCALIVERKIAKSVLFPKEILYMEDVIWNMQVFEKSAKIAFLPETTYAYRQNPDSATHIWKLSIIPARIQALCLMKKLLPSGYKLDSWYALRVLSSYSIICKCCIKTDELPSLKMKIRYMKKIDSAPLWRILKQQGITDKWTTKCKLKRFLAVKNILPVFYYFQSVIYKYTKRGR